MPFVPTSSFYAGSKHGRDNDGQAEGRRGRRGVSAMLQIDESWLETEDAIVKLDQDLTTAYNGKHEEAIEETFEALSGAIFDPDKTKCRALQALCVCIGLMKMTSLCMERYPENEDLQVKGIQVFHALVHENHENAKLVHFNNGIRWICCAMSKHDKSRPLTRCALNVLMDLCADSSCVKVFVRLKGFEIISSIMVAFNRDEVVMADACGVLSMLLKKECVDSNQALIQEFTSPIINAMYQHLENINIQSYCLSALLKICSSPKGAKHLVKDAGDSLAVVMETLDRNQGENHILEMVCSLIKTLLEYPELKEAIFDAEVASAFRELIRSDEVFLAMFMA